VRHLFFFAKHPISPILLIRNRKRIGGAEASTFIGLGSRFPVRKGFSLEWVWGGGGACAEKRAPLPLEFARLSPTQLFREAF